MLLPRGHQSRGCSHPGVAPALCLCRAQDHWHHPSFSLPVCARAGTVSQHSTGPGAMLTTQRGVLPALTFQDGHVDLRHGLVLGVEALFRWGAAADTAGLWGQPLLGTVSLLLLRGPGKAESKAQQGATEGQEPSAVPGLPWPPLQSTLALGSPHLAAWCWGGASLGSVHHRWSGMELVWLSTGQGSRKMSRTPCTHSPSMPWQCPVRCQGQLRGTGMWRCPAQPCPELSWDRTCTLRSPRLLAGLWDSVTPVSTWGDPRWGS